MRNDAAQHRLYRCSASGQSWNNETAYGCEMPRRRSKREQQSGEKTTSPYANRQKHVFLCGHRRLGWHFGLVIEEIRLLCHLGDTISQQCNVVCCCRGLMRTLVRLVEETNSVLVRGRGRATYCAVLTPKTEDRLASNSGMGGKPCSRSPPPWCLGCIWTQVP